MKGNAGRSALLLASAAALICGMLAAPAERSRLFVTADASALVEQGLAAGSAALSGLPMRAGRPERPALQ
jgi:hypothetical protein